MASATNPGLSLDPWLLLEVFGEPILAELDGTALSVSIPADTGRAAVSGNQMPTAGDILNAVIDLIEPGRVLELDPPWDALMSFQLPHLKFSMDFGPARSMEFDVTQIGLSIGPASLTSINFKYLPATGGKKGSQKKQFICSVDANIGGLPLQAPSWNMMGQPAPAPVPTVATPPIFQLDYLAFGQCVSLTSPASTFDGVLGQLTGTPPKDDISPLPSTALQFDAGASWLAGTNFSVMGAITLGVVFNDPALYGAKISLSGPKVKVLAGLSFEILYRSIADGLGLYHIELKLPDQFRRFDIGAATLTLPVIDLDIYTDGSFLFDFGFPYNHDYSQSATLEMIILGIPVLGAGGFYFGVLDQQAVPSLPQLLPNTGVFSPVIVFGLGLKIGLGKSIDEGILQAGFELAVEGIVEGVLAFYESSDKSVTDTYYKVSGLIALVGHLYGSIDFVVIKARVDLMVYASVQFVYEAYKGAVITMEADVSVQVSLDVDLGVFSFSVQFSFAAHVEADFTIDVADNHKWIAKAA